MALNKGVVVVDVANNGCLADTKWDGWSFLAREEFDYFRKLRGVVGVTRFSTKQKASSKSCIFQAKLRSLIWLKTSKDKKFGNLDGWWYSPKNPRALKLDLKRTAECPYKFTVDVAFIRRGWGIGGVLVSGKGDIRVIFSSPSLCCYMIHAEVEAIKLAQLWSYWEIFADIDELSTRCKSVSFSLRILSGFENVCRLARDGTSRSETFKAWW
ncbi:hypothetical protein GQ457_09G019760 [Hibiscus cannabinus]